MNKSCHKITLAQIKFKYLSQKSGRLLYRFSDFIELFFSGNRPVDHRAIISIILSRVTERPEQFDNVHNTADQEPDRTANAEDQRQINFEVPQSEPPFIGNTFESELPNRKYDKDHKPHERPQNRGGINRFISKSKFFGCRIYKYFA